MLTQDYFEGDIWFFPENTAHTVVALDDGCYFLTGARMHHIACLPCWSLSGIEPLFPDVDILFTLKHLLV